MLPDFPASVRELFERRALEETPKKTTAAFLRSRWWKILSNETAEKAAAAEASRQGFAVEIDHSCDDWDYAKTADYLLDRLRTLRSGVSRACIVSGGEVTVKVPANAGAGGRNQHFALYCAQRIPRKTSPCSVRARTALMATVPPPAPWLTEPHGHAARAAGLDVQAHFDGFNSYPLFEKLGDSIQTGPTGNNVRDLRMLMAY